MRAILSEKKKAAGRTPLLLRESKPKFNQDVVHSISLARTVA